LTTIEPQKTTKRLNKFWKTVLKSWTVVCSELNFNQQNKDGGPNQLFGLQVD